MDEVMVSVICNTYNHENYIRQTLQSFVNQKTNFSFEVLVHDDASTDNTADIIREFEKNYSDFIKPIYEVENQYSKKNGAIFRLQHGRVKGKYIAFCEGDDYWTDSYKLQKQFDALEANTQIDICAHCALLERNGKIVGDDKRSDLEKIFSVEDVIKGGGGFVATASIMYRACMDRIIQDRFNDFHIDYLYQIVGSLKGGMLYLPETMSVYRLFTASSWGKRMKKNPDEYCNFVDRVNKMLDNMNSYTNYLYNDTIEERKMRNEFQKQQSLKNYKEILKPKYKDYYHSMSIKQRIKVKVFSIMKQG